MGASVNFATTQNLVGTYDNLDNGVGATFTLTATGDLFIDDNLIVLESIVLVKNQTDTKQNGIYICTIQGDSGISAQLTRWGAYTIPYQINSFGPIIVQSGTVNPGTTWYVQGLITSIGIDNIIIAQSGDFNAGQLLTTLYVDGVSGSDEPGIGIGSAIRPFATVSFALSSISDNSENKTYTIFVNGQLVESDPILLKPWVSIVGTSKELTNIGTSLELDAVWNTVNGQWATVSNLTAAGFDLEFDHGSNAKVFFENCDISDGGFFGNSFNASVNYISLRNCTVGAISVYDMNVTSFGNTFNSVTFTAENGVTQPITWSANSDTINGTCHVVEGSGQDTDMILSMCTVIGLQTTSGAAAEIVCDAVSFSHSGFTGNVVPSSLLVQSAEVKTALLQTAPASSSANYTENFQLDNGTSLTFGTPVHNVYNSDLMITVGIAVTAATAATITIGVGSGSTPSANTVIPTFTAGATTVFTVSAYIPNNYWFVIDKTGAITSTNTYVVMPV